MSKVIPFNVMNMRQQQRSHVRALLIRDSILAPFRKHLFNGAPQVFPGAVLYWSQKLSSLSRTDLLDRMKNSGPSDWKIQPSFYVALYHEIVSRFEVTETSPPAS